MVRGPGPSCTHQIRPVVPVHHFGSGAHGQEAGGEHFQVGGPGHARGHGRGAGRGRKEGGVRTLPARGETGHRVLAHPAPQVLNYETRARRGRTPPPRLRAASQGLLVSGLGLWN